MTAINPNALLGAEKDLAAGLSLIHSVYNVVYTCDENDGSSLLGTLKAGTRLLRAVHVRLCNAIGDEGGWTEAIVNGLPSRLDAVLEQLDVADVSVRAAILSPFLLAADEVRQEAAVEQMRSASIILKNAIEHIEKPTI